jgi:uncharacterized membrane protein YciS (DUF1049 family)
MVFAIGAVTFSLQNDIPVTVVLGLWSYDSSLAVVLLVAVCVGVLIAALVSTPSVIKGQWDRARLRRQLAGAENDRASLEGRVSQLESEAAHGESPAPAAEEAAPYVGLKSILMAQEEECTK